MSVVKVLSGLLSSRTAAAADQWGLFPVGCVLEYAGSTTPAGWAECDGGAELRYVGGGTTGEMTPYFAVAGERYGAGDGLRTVNRPNRVGRVGVGAGTGEGLSARAVGARGGMEKHALTVAELAEHKHDVEAALDDGHTHIVTVLGAGQHIHTYSVADGNGGTYAPTGYHGGTARTNFETSESPSHTHNTRVGRSPRHTHVITETSVGDGAAHENMQPFEVSRFLVKVRP